MNTLHNKKLLSPSTISQCQSMTKKGKSCKNPRLRFSRYCWHHQNASNIVGWSLAIISILVSIGLSWFMWHDANLKTKQSQSSGRISGIQIDKNINGIALDIGGGPNGSFIQDKFPGILVGGVPVFEGLDVYIEDGEVKLSATIRDSSGNILAQIKANEWLVNPNRILDRNFDDKGVEVINEKGEVILQANYRGYRTIQGERFVDIEFKGVFTVPNGKRWVLGMPNSSNEPLLQLFAIVAKDYIVDFSKLFKYPSEEHRGERYRGK
ncbi:hypothetical protein ACFL4D_03260 [Candidatus Margulisiibacteriota bacterium]